MPPGFRPNASAPNILLVIADDHRADAIGALGHSVALTPELDHLVARGTTFTQARIAGGLMPAVCSPSRACLLTGCLPFRADANPSIVPEPPYEVRLPANATTVAECFRAAGYETFFTGKWHNDEAALLRSFEQGRSIFQGGMCEHTQVPLRDLEEIRRGAPVRIGARFSTELFCESAVEFIVKRDTARPFFACVALTSPHDPRTPPEPFRSMYTPPAMPLPANFRPDHPFDNGELNVRDEHLLPRPLTPTDVQNALAAYYGMISHHDACLGRVFAALTASQALENTVIVYLSDHGLALGSHGLLGKQNLYEHSVRVPLIMAGPGVPRSQRCSALVYAPDVYATLCDLARLPIPAGLDSRSLRPLMGKSGVAVRDDIVSAYMDCQRMVTDGRWKLIIYRVDQKQRVQLFDLAEDPDEVRDLSADLAFAPRIQTLQERLERWQVECGDRWMPLTAMTPLPIAK